MLLRVGAPLVDHRYQMTGALARAWALRPNLSFYDALPRWAHPGDRGSAAVGATWPWLRGGIRGQLRPDARRYRDLAEAWERSRS